MEYALHSDILMFNAESSQEIITSQRNGAEVWEKSRAQHQGEPGY